VQYWCCRNRYVERIRLPAPSTSCASLMIIQNGQSELLRARTPVGPLETPFCELLDVVKLTERTAIKRHAKRLSFAFLDSFHGSGPTASPNATAP
jgi:hypothetical protein